MIYCTADPHGNHVNILRYCNRPYKDILHMRADFIDRWNSVVKSDKDDVYIMGDLWMGKDSSSANTLQSFLKRVKGTKHLILGNHDVMRPFTYLKLGIQTVHTSLFLDEFFLCHDHTWALKLPDTQKTICGHVHTFWKTMKNCVNVGVDVWDYTPVRLDDIRYLFNSRKEDEE
jgi:calcineurin-like phosphoesterase family protein